MLDTIPSVGVVGSSPSGDFDLSFSGDVEPSFFSSGLSSVSW